MKHESVKLRLPYKPPFDYQGLLYFYRAHAMGQLEWFEGDRMHRIFETPMGIGEVTIDNDSDHNALAIEIEMPDVSQVQSVVSKIRAMFDLDADPIVVANAIEADPKLKKILKRHQGIRVPSGWDGFEVSIATILGQLVSVERGRGLTGDLIRELGREVKPGVHLFPSPQGIADADLTFLKTTGIRKQTLKLFSKAVAEKEISLDPVQDVEEFKKKIMTVKGIGRWTADYIALKVLRHTDTFPSTDLILARALELHPAETLEKARPWRGYVASLLWREYAGKLTKNRKSGKRKSQ